MTENDKKDKNSIGLGLSPILATIVIFFSVFSFEHNCCNYS